MKRASLCSVLLLAFAAQGCIFVSDDDEGGGTPDAAVLPTPDAAVPADAMPDPIGIFHATWTITKGTPAAPSDCATNGVDHISVLSTRGSDSMGFDDVFNCTDLAGDTLPLTLDTYQTVITALDAAETNLGMNDPPFDNDFTNAANCDDFSNNTCTINLPNVEFHFP